MNRLAIIAALALLAGCHKAEPAAEAASAHKVALPPISVEQGAVEVRRVPRYLTLTGSVAAERQSDVAANVSGRVVSVPVERGQKVKEGQTLAIVDSRAADLSAASSAAQSEMAETQVQQAREDCARAESLFAQGAMAKAEYNRQKTQCKAQLLQAHSAKSQASLAAKLVGDTIIRAPFAGAVGERFVNLGEYVQPPTKVASVFAYDPVRVSISVPEAATSLVREGQLLDVRVAAWPDRVFPATVVYVSPALRASTRDLVVEARAANTDAALRPGMFATVQLVVGEEELPTVPADAVLSDGTTRRIFLVRDGQAFELVVRTGVARDGRVAVHEPLDDKARVVRHPPPGLHDGSPVTIVAAAAAAPAARDAAPGVAAGN